MPSRMSRRPLSMPVTFGCELFLRPLLFPLSVAETTSPRAALPLRPRIRPYRQSLQSFPFFIAFITLPDRLLSICKVMTFCRLKTMFDFFLLVCLFIFFLSDCFSPVCLAICMHTFQFRDRLLEKVAERLFLKPKHVWLIA